MKLSLIFGLFLSFNSHAEDVNFYISSDSPQLINQLQSEFNRSGLQHITVKSTDFWHPYIQGLRQGRSGIYFAAPHFTSWAIEQHQFIPLMKLAGELQYVLVSRREDINIFEVSDLARKRICASKAPNLDYILANTALSKSLNSPKIITQNSAFQSLQSDNKDCDAFVISEHHFHQHTNEHPYELVRLQQGRKYPNYAFLSSPNIDNTTLEKFTALILRPSVKSLLKPVYSNYSNEPALIKIAPGNYKKSDSSFLKKTWDNIE